MELSVLELQFLLEALESGKHSFKEKSYKYVHAIEGYVERQKEVLDQYSNMINKLQQEKRRLKNGS